MTKVGYDVHETLQTVKLIMAEHNSGVVCEMTMYGFRIGCGVEDAHGMIFEEIFPWKGLDRKSILELALALQARTKRGIGTSGY